MNFIKNLIQKHITLGKAIGLHPIEISKRVNKDLDKSNKVIINKDTFDQMNQILHNIYTSGHCEKSLNQISSNGITYYQDIKYIMKQLRIEGL